MIIYENSGVFGGIETLGRFHGSAAYKAALPALISTCILFLYNFLVDFESTPETVRHPNAIQAFVVFYTFLLTFRLNFSYGRYWEGATAVSQMLSKWIDCAICLGAFHYQSSQYDDIKPPAFGDLDETTIVSQVKGRNRIADGQVYTVSPESLGKEDRRTFWQKVRGRREDMASSQHTIDNMRSKKSISSHSRESSDRCDAAIPIPVRFQEQFFRNMDEAIRDKEGKEDPRHSWLIRQPRAYRNIKKTRLSRLPAPSLFLQETAHLISLLSAVALSTLRNDIDQAASPVVPYIPGMPWPPADPDDLEKEIQKEYGESNFFWKWVYFCLGLTRSQKHRTLYNAARPFGVLGGCSDSEITMLQSARGPYAKVNLATMWLHEFISRESLAGSTGKIHGPVLSRLYQYISDGVAGYNQARKVAYVPFPFPHGQITAFFSLATMFIFPLLYGTTVRDLWLAGLLNFLTCICFLGIHEVARELENPFQNVPNDIPLTTFQAEMNEALVTIYAGFHPDAWWDVVREDSVVEAPS